MYLYETESRKEEFVCARTGMYLCVGGGGGGGVVGANTGMYLYERWRERNLFSAADSLCLCLKTVHCRLLSCLTSEHTHSLLSILLWCNNVLGVGHDHMAVCIWLLEVGQGDECFLDVSGGRTSAGQNVVVLGYSDRLARCPLCGSAAWRRPTQRPACRESCTRSALRRLCSLHTSFSLTQRSGNDSWCSFFFFSFLKGGGRGIQLVMISFIGSH